MEMNKRFEYRVEPIPFNPAMDKQQVKASLDEIGREGWELTFKDGQFYYFRREVA
jgi:hypothetical protein